MNNERVPAVIFDVDGTLALRTSDRSPYDWERVGEDDPNRPVVELAKIIAAQCRILIVSGRDAVCRAQTEAWLCLHDVPFEALYMRPRKDYRKDSNLKEEIYRRYIEPRYDVLLVVDDRKQCVKRWRELGLTCAQVADGDF